MEESLRVTSTSNYVLISHRRRPDKYGLAAEKVERLSTVERKMYISTLSRRFITGCIVKLPAGCSAPETPL